MAVPVNTKSLLAFIGGQMEKLDQGQISVEQASAQAKLMKQANNLLHYELDRADMQMKLIEFGGSVKLREIESKAFDDTINK